MFRKSVKLAIAGAVVAASAVAMAPSPGAFAAAEGAASLSASSGTGSTAFNLTLPSGASCSGTGGQGYTWETFIASANVGGAPLDVGTLVFADGPNQPAGTFTSSLTSTAGDVVKQKFPGLGGLISGIPQLNFSSLIGSGITAGAYKVGIFCSNQNPGGTVGRLDAGHYWEKLITVTNASTLAWQLGAVPPALTLSAVTPGNGTCSFPAGFTTTTADPVATYAVSTVPATVTTAVTPGTAITLGSLTNGTAYAVTVTATNTVGTTSSNTVNCTPAVTVAAPSPFTATSGVGQVVLNWTPATVPGGYTLVNHIVTVAPSVAGSPFTVAAGTNTLTVPASTVATYTFTIQATYSPATGVTALTATATADSLPAQVILQDITVNRPVGALVLTQRCGVNGELPAVGADATNGFDALALLPASLNQTGAAPTFPTLTGTPVSAGEFNQYPYPVDANGVPNPTYSTHCAINLGKGKLITSGPRAGQYFTATGNINQVTVVDTRDTDPGFTINANVSTFTNGTSTFSGNYLGWQPVVSSTSGLTLAGYDQTVAPGTTLQPSLATGLATNKALASANSGAGLGIATLDARLKLLIPLTARNGDFTATMTFTTA